MKDFIKNLQPAVLIALIFTILFPIIAHINEILFKWVSGVEFAFACDFLLWLIVLILILVRRD